MQTIPKALIILALITQRSFGVPTTCQVKFFPKVVYIGEKGLIPTNELIETSNCPIELQKKVHELVLNSQGPLKASYLKKAIGDSLEITPEQFELIPLASMINLPENWLWENIEILGGKKAIQGTEVFASCPSCTSLGKKVIEIRIDNKTFWANGELRAFAPALISKTTIPSNKEVLSKDDFSLINKPLLNPDDYFTSLEDIQFYKLNQDLPAGTLLKKSNIRKIDLIRPGNPVTLSLISDGISIKGTGIPMSSGKIGDQVKIKSQKNNAILYGKVIGENAVSVNL